VNKLSFTAFNRVKPIFQWMNEIDDSKIISKLCFYIEKSKEKMCLWMGLNFKNDTKYTKTSWLTV
jgi:hypothetical protein